MLLVNLFCLICLISFNYVICDEESVVNVEAVDYLKKFGYLNDDLKSANILTKESFHEAIKDFQRFSGLEETGNLDNHTLKLMALPRCGNKDKPSHRHKRYALQGSKWKGSSISYRIQKFSNQGLNKHSIRDQIEKAFKIWSDVTPLEFLETSSGPVHILLGFFRGDHGDHDPFDGPGHTLAHAFFPQHGGDVHFDDDEKWTLTQYPGKTHLLQVAAHEIGHALGLSHSENKNSLMAPFYKDYENSVKLSADDVQGIQALYGKKHKSSWRNYKPTTSHEPDICNIGKLDTITQTENGKTFVFKDSVFWEIGDNGPLHKFPRKISDEWDHLPNNIDASFTWSDGNTFFFKGSDYWKFTNKKGHPGYPKNISAGFPGIPNNIDAAVVWSGNGDKYWRYDSKSSTPVSSKYPKPLLTWKGLPRVDAAFKWKNNLTYFFTNNDYYRFDDGKFEVDANADPPYPRKTSVWWFNCTDSNYSNNEDLTRAETIEHFNDSNGSTLSSVSETEKKEEWNGNTHLSVVMNSALNFKIKSLIGFSLSLVISNIFNYATALGF